MGISEHPHERKFGSAAEDHIAVAVAAQCVMLQAQTLICLRSASALRLRAKHKSTTTALHLSIYPSECTGMSAFLSSAAAAAVLVFHRFVPEQYPN